MLKSSNEGIVKIGDNLAEIAVKEEDEEVSCNSEAKDKEIETGKQDFEAYAETYSDQEVGKECLSNLDKVENNGDIREASIERDTGICSEQEADCDKTMVEDCEKEISKSKAAEIFNIHRKVMKIDDQEVKVNVTESDDLSTQMVLQGEMARACKQERVECVGEVLVPLSNTGVTRHSDNDDSVTTSSINEGITTEMSSNGVNLASEAVTETQVLGDIPSQIRDTKAFNELEEDHATKNTKMDELEDFGSTEEEGPVTESSGQSTEMASTSETDEEIDDPYLYFEFSSSFGDTSESTDPDNTLVFKGKSEDNVLVNKLPCIPQYMLFPSLSDPQKPARTVTFYPYIKFQLIPARNVESDFRSSPELSPNELPLPVSDASIEGESDGDAIEAISTEDEESAEIKVTYGEGDLVNETQVLRTDEKAVEIKDVVVCEVDSLVKVNNEEDIGDEEVVREREAEVDEKPVKVGKTKNVEVHDIDIIQVRNVKIVDDSVAARVSCEDAVQASGSGNGKTTGMNVNKTDLIVESEGIVEIEELDANSLQIRDSPEMREAESDNADRSVRANDAGDLEGVVGEDWELELLNQHKRISSCKTNDVRLLENEEIDLETARERQGPSLDSSKLDKPKVSYNSLYTYLK